MRPDSFWGKVVQVSRARRPLFQITASPWWTDVLVAAGAQRARTDDSMTVEFREGSMDSPGRPPVPPTPETGSGTVVMSARYESDLARAADCFRSGMVVALDFTGMSEADVQRAVHFSTGLVEGLRGSLQRISDTGLLLMPAAHAELLVRDPDLPKDRALAEEVIIAEYRLAERLRNFGIEVQRGDVSFPVVGPETSIGPESPETSIGPETKEDEGPIVSALLTLQRALEEGVMEPDELTGDIEAVLVLLHQEQRRRWEKRLELSRDDILLSEYLAELHVLVEGRQEPFRLHSPGPVRREILRVRMTREVRDVLVRLQRELRRESLREHEERLDRLHEES
jgi:Cell division protein SepF